MTSQTSYSRNDLITAMADRIRTNGPDQHDLTVIDLADAGAVYRDGNRWIVDLTDTVDALYDVGLCAPSTDPNGNTHMLATPAGEQAIVDADIEQAEVHQAQTVRAVRRAATAAALSGAVIASAAYGVVSYLAG